MKKGKGKETESLNLTYPHIAAKKLGKSLRTIYRLIQKGVLLSVRDSNGKLKVCLPKNIPEYTVNNIAICFNISRRTVYKLVKEGKLKSSHRLGTQRGIRFTADDINKYLNDYML